MLYIIATPIGNLKDITLRSIETLKEVDVIICEDTRRTAILLNHYQIKKTMYVLNDFNETKNFPEIIERLRSGQNLALVSDAGTPLISDPGYKLIRECIAQNLEIDSLPGPSSVITALTLSSMPPDKFTFLGYLPEKNGQRIKLLESLLEVKKSLSATYIIFISPYKLVRTFDDLIKIFGDMELTLAHELTKIHQSVETKKVSEWIEKFKKSAAKGEYIGLFNIS